MPKPKLVDTDQDDDPTDDVDMVKVPFRGSDFEIPKDMDEWDTEACLALGAGNYTLAAKILLGPRQWEILRALGTKRKDNNAFLTVFAGVVSKECVG